MELPQRLGEQLCSQPSNHGAAWYGEESLTQPDEASTSVMSHPGRSTGGLTSHCAQ